MTQQQALKVMLSGSNVFLTGPPGSGKTYLLNRFIDIARSRGLKVAVTATTGIAAVHLNGITIHSWSATGLNDHLSYEQKRRLAANPKVSERYQAVNVLVIDEISMLSPAKLKLVHELACFVLGINRAMAGIQLILVGDFFQLPPVNLQSREYLFESNIWQQLELQICYLTEQHRQQVGDELNSILGAIRHNRLARAQLAVLASKLNTDQLIQTNVLRLYARNYQVDNINDHKLAELATKLKQYKMLNKGPAEAVSKLQKAILSPELLNLKIGAEVIFTANDYAAGYVNGDRGRLVDFRQGLPVIRMYRQAYIVVEPHKWVNEVNGKVLAEAWQIPLKLAWAITIHKSQGMSLDEAEIDLRGSFAYGMGYVALSRLRNIDGLYLTGLSLKALKVDAKVVKLDKILREQSDKLITKIMTPKRKYIENSFS